MADERIFTIKINGVEQSYKEVVRLRDALDNIEGVTAKVSKATSESTKQSKEKTKALTDEEKAQKKLAETQEKAAKPISDIEKAQVLANQQLKERARLLSAQAQEENNSINSMKANLAVLRDELSNTNVDSDLFKTLSADIEELDSKIKSLSPSTNGLTKQLNELSGKLSTQIDTLGNNINKTAENTKGMLNTFQAGVGIALIFDESNEELGKTLNSVGKIMATVSALQGGLNALIKTGTVTNIAYSLQNKARAGLDVLVTKGIITQTAAQTALNIATRAFPLLALIGGLTAIIGLLTSASDKTITYTSALDGMSYSTQEAVDKHDSFLRRIRDIQIEIDLANGKITEYQASLMRLANSTADAIEKEKAELIKNLDEIDSKYSSFTNKLSTYFKNYFNTDYKAITPWGLSTDPKYIEDQLKERENATKQSVNNMSDIYVESYIRDEKEAAEKAKRDREDAKAQSQKLADLIKERNKIELELTRQAQDSTTELIVNEFDRREEQIRLKYERQREDLRKRLAEDKNLTIDSRNAIQEIILNSSDFEIAELKRVSEERAKDNEDKINKQRETWERIRQLNSENADKEAEENSKIADKELLNLTKQLEAKTITQQKFDNSLLNLSISSLEKEISIRKKYGQDTTQLEIELSRQRIDLAKNEKDQTLKQFEELGKKLQGYANNIMTGFTSIFDSVNSILESQLEDAREKYDTISKQYDEVVEKREESDSRLQELEEKANNARGGRQLIYQEQVNAEMQVNAQLANQEKQLAKDKEKQEAEIAKKEKQQKRVDLSQKLVQGFANTALGVTEALASSPPPLNFVLASLVGAAGAVQTGVITAQLAKLEDGGLLKGKRHSQGGMRVEGTNIEVEGGEYVVNRESTKNNIGLIRYINSQRKELTPNDIKSYFSSGSKGSEPPFKRMFETGGQLPNIENTITVDNGVLAEAIKSMKIEPKVSVTDINTAQKDTIRVNDWTGL